MPLINRRNVVFSTGLVAASGVIRACGPAAPAAGAAAETAAAVLPEVLPKVGAALQITFGLALSIAATMGKRAERALMAMEGASVVAEGAGKLSQRASVPAAAAVGGSPASPKPSDVVVTTIDAAKSDFTATIHLVAPPLLPGASRPENYLWLVPVIWNQSGIVETAPPRQIAAEELLQPNELWSPSLTLPQLQQPGLYRLGYQLRSSNDDQIAMYGGGPILQLLLPGDWNYEREIQSGAALERPQLVYSDTYQTDPAQDEILASLA